MSMEGDIKKQFVMSAMPWAWFRVACNLYEQSVSLYEQGNNAIEIIQDWENGTEFNFIDVSRSAFLLSGFAIENTLKAFLVYEYPEWISNGKIHVQLNTHSLVKLSEKSSLVPWKKKGLKTLSAFEEGLNSWARYPCALKAIYNKQEKNMSTKLWADYLSLMKVYGASFTKLLSKEWSDTEGYVVGVKQILFGNYLGATFMSPEVPRILEARGIKLENMSLTLQDIFIRHQVITNC